MMNGQVPKIGEAAGFIYHELENGECSLTQLKNNLLANEFDNNICLMSIGWLARENKVDIDKKGNKWFIKLKNR
ncbi:MAG: winged helix-turn-helix domain-containing protein [Methanosarcinaceae archaeon]|nr:winged helix-turn-helix domain-containing protein [Methanosarcinaceae archaeon]